MSCCGNRKNRVKPTGSKKTEAAEKQAVSTRMGSRRTATFAVKTKTGKVLSFESKLEALAEQARNGGTLKF